MATHSFAPREIIRIRVRDLEALQRGYIGAEEIAINTKREMWVNLDAHVFIYEKLPRNSNMLMIEKPLSGSYIVYLEGQKILWSMVSAIPFKESERVSINDD